MKKTIGIIFDFDDTLAPDTTSAFLENIGIDSRTFWENTVTTLSNNGWDRIPAYLYSILKISQTKSSNYTIPITKNKFFEFGKNISFYSGIITFFSRMNKFILSQSNNINIEYYIISSGIGEIIRASKIAKHFKNIVACEYHYNNKGEINFPKRIINFTDKTRILFQISKGIIGDNTNEYSFDVNKRVNDKNFRIPLSRIIYIGDGYTDIPCFTIVSRYGGYAIGVYDDNNLIKMKYAWNFVDEKRVSNLLPADYKKGSALEQTIKMALIKIVSKI